MLYESAHISLLTMYVFDSGWRQLTAVCVTVTSKTEKVLSTVSKRAPRNLGQNK